MKRWDGAMVCEADYETRHPQEFVRARRDNPKLPFIRPDVDSADIAITTDCDALSFGYITAVELQALINAQTTTTVYKLRVQGPTIEVPTGKVLEIVCNLEVL